MKHSIIIFILVIFTIFTTLTACRQPVPAGTRISASGIVLDTVKNKVLANAKLYLFGAHSTFYGIYYNVGPLDSTVSDNNGKFSISFTANGSAVDYGLQLDVLDYGGTVYNNQSNYVLDRTQPIFQFNYSRNISNAVVKGRELNYIKIHLQVLANPFDTFYVSTTAISQATLIKGQTIDTTILVRHLPNGFNEIRYYTRSERDTVGIRIPNPNGLFSSIRRMVMDTLIANMADTINISKTIPNGSLMPRR